MMGEVSSFIASVGFPIAMACGFALVMYNIFMVVFKKIIETLDVLTSTNKELIETNKQLTKSVLDTVNEIDCKLDKVLDKMR